MRCPVFAILLFTCLLSSCREESPVAPALPEYLVGVAHPRQGNVAVYREWVGLLEGLVSAQVLPQVSGYISQRLFVNGQAVHAGQALYRIEATRYRQQLEHARQQEAEAAATAQEAQQNVEYYRPLVKTGSISRQQYTDALAHAQATQAALAAARANVSLARTNVAYCTLVSPVDGLVGFAQADVGSYVSPQGAPLVLVNQVNPIRVVFAVSEQDWLDRGGEGGSLHPGAEAELILPNGKHYSYPAVVQGVDNTVSSTTGTLMMDARTPNPAGVLRPGMFVLVRARVAERKDALLVPESAVVSMQGKTMLLLVGAGGRPQLRSVEVGPRQGGLVSVQGAGLSPSSRIIIRGTQQGLMAASGRARLRMETLSF